MPVPSALTLRCETCGEVPHRVLHGRVGKEGRTFEGTVKCTSCGTIRQAEYREPETVEVEIMVSWMDRTERHALTFPRNREIRVGDRLTAPGGEVEVTAVELEGARRSAGRAAEVVAVWAKRVDEVRVKVAVTHGARTYSRKLFAAPDEEFEVGEILEIGKERVVVHRIQLAGRVLNQGVAPAEHIVRLLCKRVRESVRY